MRTFFTSDTHYGHANIIKYSKRPFKSVEEMDERMITAWNERVGVNDFVYHLGDFGFAHEKRIEEILTRLNGKKFLIWGNHDKVIHKSRRLQEQFVRCTDYLELKVNDKDAPQGIQQIILFHYPIMSWNKMHRGSWHIHGHCHHNLRYPFKGRIIDAGVDGKGYNFAPLSYDEVKSRMLVVEPQFLDHHTEK